MSKADIVWLLAQRRLAVTSRAIWGQPICDLLEKYAPIPTEAEAIALSDHRVERAKIDGGLSSTVLSQQIRGHGLPIPSGCSREGLLDILLDVGPTTTQIILDEDQIAAIAAAVNMWPAPVDGLRPTLDNGLRPTLDDLQSAMDGIQPALDGLQPAMVDGLRPADLQPKLDTTLIPTTIGTQAALEKPTNRLYIHAGPGSGKTTTLCNITQQLDAANISVLVLAYNIAAESILRKRLKSLGVSLKSNGRIDSEHGVVVLTFDKFAYQIMRTAGIASTPTQSQDSYSSAREQAIMVMQSQTIPFSYDAIVVDEAQDLTPELAEIVEILAAQWPAARLILAGDPRQELYARAAWFSHNWAGAPANERRTLRYNHRSAGEIVAALNAYSRHNFPTIHQDQIATRGGGVVKIFTACGKRKFFNENAAIQCGGIIGTLMSDVSRCYAIAPVTINKYKLETVTATARQIVYDKRPGEFVNVDLDNGALTAAPYVISGSQRLKGTESPRVIVFGTEPDYSHSCTPKQLLKLMFVALSRAQDELFIVQHRHTIHAVSQSLKPIFDICGEIIESTGRIREDNPPRHAMEISAASGDDLLSGGLCTHSGIQFKTIPANPTNCIDLGVPRGDADFMGVYAEALVRDALGLPLMTPANIDWKESTDPSMVRIYYTSPAFCIESGKLHLGFLKNLMAEIKKDGGVPAYQHAVCRYTIQIARRWTVSERFNSVIDDKLKIAVAQIVAHLLATTNASSFDPVQCAGLHPLICRRSRKRFGQIWYETDFLAKTSDGVSIPIELKHTAQTTDNHRRQLAIYVKAVGATRGLLCNTRTGECEWIINDICQEDSINHVAQAAIALRYGRHQAASTLLCRTIQAPPEVATASCLVVVDTETLGAVIEIAAIAVDPTNWQIIAVFDQRATGVREDPHPVDYVVPDVGRPDVEKMTGLLVDMDECCDTGLLRSFTAWIKALPTRRACIHWGGSEKKLLAGENNIVDLYSRGFLPWLGHGKDHRRNKRNLLAAVSQLIPDLPFVPHRAYEDVIATMAALAAMYTFDGAV